MVEVNNNNQIQKSRRYRIIAVAFALLVIAGGFMFYRQHKSTEDKTYFGTVNAQTDSYHVDASKPVKLEIPSIKLDAKVGEVDLNPDHTLGVPQKFDEVGWYKQSPTPGELGPSILVGHLDSATSAAVFWNLKSLKQGDKILVTREDGSVVTFQVDSMKSVSQNNFPTEEVYGSIDFAGLRLITCDGVWNKREGHYSNNLVVFASIVKPEENK